MNGHENTVPMTYWHALPRCKSKKRTHSIVLRNIKIPPTAAKAQCPPFYDARRYFGARLHQLCMRERRGRKPAIARWPPTA